MTLIARFPGKCSKCGGPITPGQEIEWDRDTRQSQHTTPGDCEGAKAAAAQRVDEDAAAPHLDLTAIREFVLRAKNSGLAWPKVRVLGPDEETTMELTLTGERSREPNSLAVKFGGRYIGCVRPGGRCDGELRSDEPMQQHLLEIATNPAWAAKLYAQHTSNCSFCGTQLTDEGSIEVGYGPICAERYGLPHKAKGSKKVVLPLHEPIGQVELNEIADERESRKYEARPAMDSDRQAALVAKILNSWKKA